MDTCQRGSTSEMLVTSIRWIPERCIENNHLWDRGYPPAGSWCQFTWMDAVMARVF